MRQLTEAAAAVELMLEKKMIGYVDLETANFSVRKNGDKVQVVLGNGTVIAESNGGQDAYKKLFEAAVAATK